MTDRTSRAYNEPGGRRPWIKIVGVAIAVLIVLVVVMMVIGGGSGGHGPGRHKNGSDPAPDHTPPAGRHGMLAVAR